MRRYAVYFGSSAIYQDMVPAAKSLLAHTDVDRVYFLIEHDQFPYELPDCIQTVNISKAVPYYFSPNSPNYGTMWTYIGLIRVALSKVFPKHERMLSIDCDTIVTEDISELWDLPLDDYYFAAVREPKLSREMNTVYINAGVMMLNLDKLRADGKDDELIYALNTRRYRYVAQDVMTERCQGKILELPSEYNSCQFTAHTDEPKIVHFAGSIKMAWRYEPLYQKYVDMPWDKVIK